MTQNYGNPQRGINRAHRGNYRITTIPNTKDAFKSNLLTSSPDCISCTKTRDNKIPNNRACQLICGH